MRLIYKVHEKRKIPACKRSGILLVKNKVIFYTAGPAASFISSNNFFRS